MAFKVPVSTPLPTDELDTLVVGEDGQEMTQEQALIEEFGEDLVVQVNRIVVDCIKEISKRQSYFKESALLRQALKKARGELSREIMEHPKFDTLLQWALLQPPLLMLGDTRHLVTPEMMEMEKETLLMAGAEPGDHVLPEWLVQAAIEQKKGISEEQIAAVHTCTLSKRTVSVVEGTAGAGKSFTMQAVKEAFMADGYDVVGVALSHNAAKVLSDSIGIAKGQAIEGFIGRMRRAREAGTEYFQAKTVIIVDEAGMVGTRHMYHILREAKLSKFKHKIVLTGDSLQVNPVEAGNILEAIVETHGTTRIDTIRRQKQESHRIAVKRFSRKEAGAALYPFVQQERVHWCEDEDVLFNKIVQDYLSYRLQNPDKTVLILALRNKDVAEFNRRVRAAFRKLGKIGAFEAEVKVTDGNEQWTSSFSIGDEVVLRSNDANLLTYRIDPDASTVDDREWTAKAVGVYNRNSGRIVGIRKAVKPVGSWDFIVDVGTGEEAFRAVINSENFKHPEKQGLPMVHNFATTIYGSQGQTVNNVLIMDSPNMQFRLAYVGMSRHTEDVELYLDETAIHRNLNDACGKSKTLADVIAAQNGQDIKGPVELGRYTRSAMLQSVALSFGKEARNMTATVFERRHRLGLLTEEHQIRTAEVEPVSATDPVIDFIPELNVRRPSINLEQIMGLPDPIAETEMVRPSEAEDARAADPRDRAPERAKVNPSDPTVAPVQVSEDKHSLFSKPLAWLRGMGHPEEPKAAVAQPKRALHRDTDVVVDAFAAPEGETEEAKKIRLRTKAHKEKMVIPVNKKDGLGAPAFTVGWGVQPEPLSLDQIPFHPLSPSVGSIDEQGVLRFDHVPQTSSTGASPSDAFLLEHRGVHWEVGRGGEPRIITLQHRPVKAGEKPKLPLTHRYRLDGKCVVGDGYPPMILNRHGNVNSPIYIVPGAKEWLLMTEHMRKRHADEPAKVPHMIWAAKEVDWRWIAEALQGKKVVIVRSRTDDSQMAWAAGLQQLLADPKHMGHFPLEASVIPPLPGAPMAPPTPQPGDAPVVDEEPLAPPPAIRVKPRR